MRDAFIKALYEIAQQDRDDRIVLLSGDIGFQVFDKFRADFPNKFINCGIAEQNMIGMAAGLAMQGKIPFVYTIIPFLTMRAFEQIRVDVCMHNLPVKLVGVGGGLAYGMLGPTHHAIEDIAIMRALPNMAVFVPADPIETYCLTRSISWDEGPCYLRLGKNGEPVLPTLTPYDDICKTGTRILREGNNATIITCGPIAKIALDAAQRLEKQGIMCRVISFHTIKPIDDREIYNAMAETDAIVTLEEHNVIGGLGNAVAQIVAESKTGIPFGSLGINDLFTETVGDQKYLWQEHGLTPEGVASAIMGLLKGRK